MRANTRWIRVGLAMSLAVTAIGCEEQAEQEEPADPAPPEAVTEVVNGPPGHIPCAVSSGEVVRAIGPAGDSLVLGLEETARAARQHILIVPPSAVRSTPIEFRLRHTGQAYVSVHATHQGEPTRFEPPLTLRLGYAGCNALPEDTVGLRLYVRENDDSGWQPVTGSVHQPDQQAVEAPRSTLSEYALGVG